MHAYIYVCFCWVLTFLAFVVAVGVFFAIDVSQDLLNVATIASGSTVMGGIIAKAFEKVRRTLLLPLYCCYS